MCLLRLEALLMLARKGGVLRLLVVAVWGLCVASVLVGCKPNQRPTASFTPMPNRGRAPLQVVFDGSASSDPDGKITKYTWDFGDGTMASGSASTITHTYVLQGTYTAKLTVTDNRGKTHPAPGQPIPGQSITVEAPSLPPIVAEIEPPDGAVVRGTEVWVRWRSPLPATGRVLWHRVGESRVRSAEAQGGERLLARLGPLQDGQTYEYVVEQVIDELVQRSAMRTFTVEAGVAFDPPTVEKTIERDYDQTVMLTLRNHAQAPVTVAARALVQFDDLPADVVGPGSVDDPQDLAPGQTLALRLAVFAPDATREVYEIPVEAAGATATVRMHIAKPKFDLAFRIVREEPPTLAKTIDIVNQGQTLTDLAVRIAPPHTGEVRLQPSATHARLEAGGIMSVVASPVLYLEFVSLQAELEATAAGQSVRFPLEFKTPPGTRLLGARSSSTLGTFCRDWYCTNKPTTCSECSGPVANGPATPPEGANSPGSTGGSKGAQLRDSGGLSRPTLAINAMESLKEDLPSLADLIRQEIGELLKAAKMHNKSIRDIITSAKCELFAMIAGLIPKPLWIALIGESVSIAISEACEDRIYEHTELSDGNIALAQDLVEGTGSDGQSSYGLCEPRPGECSFPQSSYRHVCINEAIRLQKLWNTLFNEYEKYASYGAIYDKEEMDLLEKIEQVERHWKIRRRQCCEHGVYIGEIRDPRAIWPAMAPPKGSESRNPLESYFTYLHSRETTSQQDQLHLGLPHLPPSFNRSPHNQPVSYRYGAWTLLAMPATVPRIPSPILLAKAQASAQPAEDLSSAPEAYSRITTPFVHPIAVREGATNVERLGASVVEALRWEAAYLRAYTTSYKRYRAAQVSNDRRAVAQQAKAMRRFAQLGLEASQTAALKGYEFERLMHAELEATFAAIGEKGVRWQEALSEFQRKLKTGELPPKLRDILVAANMTEAEIEAYRQRLLELTLQQIEEKMAAEKRRLQAISGVREALVTKKSTALWPEPPDVAAWIGLQYLSSHLLQEAGTTSDKAEKSQGRRSTLKGAQLRPGLLEALQRRTSFTRAHRGPFAAPFAGDTPDSSNMAAGWHGGDRVVFAWHQAKDQIVFAAFDPRGEPLVAPQVVGNGRWPRLATDDKRTAVAWRTGDHTLMRLHDGEQWGDEIEIAGVEAALTFAPGGALYAATTTGLWRLTESHFVRLQETAYSQPAIAMDQDNQPHVAWQRHGQIVYDGADVGEGERPSLALAPDGTVHLAYLSQGALVLRSRKADAWSPPETISATQPSWPALALGTDGLRLTYLGAAAYGPDALWLVRLPDQEPILVPSLAGNVTDAWFMLTFDLHSARSNYRPHDVLVTVNDVWIKLFQNTIPEGRYLFRLNPYQIFTSPGRPVPNRVAIHSWHMNGGSYATNSDYRLMVRTAWSEYYAFAANPEDVVRAAEASLYPRPNHNQPDLVILANNLDLPVTAPPSGSVDFPVTIVNLGEADSHPRHLVMRSQSDELARVDVPLLKPDERVTITLRLDTRREEGHLDRATFQLEGEPRDSDETNDSLELRLWSKEDYPPFPPEPPTQSVVTVVPTTIPNDVQPPWVAGQLPPGAQQVGEWVWHDHPVYAAARSHAGKETEGLALHYFIRARERLPLAPGDNLVQYVYLDPAALPQQILLQLYVEGEQVAHRVYWGEDLIDLGGTPARRLGPLPEAGKWVRLRVPVEQFGLTEGWIDGMLYGHYDGRPWWGPTSKSLGRLDPTPDTLIVSRE